MSIKDAASMENEGDHDGDEPTAEELEQMRRATPVEAATVDALILGKCSSRWSKVAMIVGLLLNEFDEKFPHLPYIYMPIRMLDLEERGLIEIQGNVLAMGFSEIRICDATKVNSRGDK